MIVAFTVIVPGKLRHTFALSPQQRRSRLFTKYTHMTEQRKLLSTREAAGYCGFSLSYFRKLMMRRVIPMYKPTGKLCFFKKEDLDAFLMGIRISSQEEIAEEAGRYLAGRK